MALLFIFKVRVVNGCKIIYILLSLLALLAECAFLFALKICSKRFAEDDKSRGAYSETKLTLCIFGNIKTYI